MHLVYNGRPKWWEQPRFAEYMNKCISVSTYPFDPGRHLVSLRRPEVNIQHHYSYAYTENIIMYEKYIDQIYHYALKVCRHKHFSKVHVFQLVDSGIQTETLGEITKERGKPTIDHCRNSRYSRLKRQKDKIGANEKNCD